MNRRLWLLPLCLLAAACLGGCATTGGAACCGDGCGDNVACRRAMGKLDILVGAVEQYHARTGAYPGDLKLLVTGPSDYGRTWEPLATTNALVDPWGNPYVIEIFPHSQARTRGLEFEITSIGEDHVAGTADDMSAPDPVNPQPPLYEGREGEAMRINEGIGLVDEMSAGARSSGDPAGLIKEGSVAEAAPPSPSMEPVIE